MTGRFGDVSDAPPPTRPHPTVDRLAWVRWTVQVMIVAVAISLAPSSRWAAVTIIGTALTVELVLIVRRRRRAAGTASDDDP